MEVVTYKGRIDPVDYLAIAILSKRYSITHIRKNLHLSDKTNSSVILVGVGGDYNPVLMNFDPTRTGESSVSLVLKKMNLENMGIFFPWVNSSYPEAAIPLLGSSPFLDYHTVGFSKRSVIDRNSMEMSRVKDLGGAIFDKKRQIEENVCEIEKKSYLEFVGGAKVLFSFVENLDGMRIYLDDNKILPDIIVCKNDRGDGLKLIRFSSKVNFNRCLGMPGVQVHKPNGEFATIENFEFKEVVLKSIKDT